MSYCFNKSYFMMIMCLCFCGFRYDEEYEDLAEDDSEKRKKEFGDLFKKQMKMRRVNLGGTVTLPLTKNFYITFLWYMVAFKFFQHSKIECHSEYKSTFR